MYSEEDINSAIEAGALSEGGADALLRSMATSRAFGAAFDRDARLRADGVAVGQRTDATEPHAVHYYSGKWGAMTWEFNVIGCDAGSLDNDAQICACNRENNGNIWSLEMGTACESTC